MIENKARPTKPHYVYLGGNIKEYYLSYAFCSACGRYLLPKKENCPGCGKHIIWDDTPYNKAPSQFK